MPKLLLFPQKAKQKLTVAATKKHIPAINNLFAFILMSFLLWLFKKQRRRKYYPKKPLKKRQCLMRFLTNLALLRFFTERERGDAG